MATPITWSGYGRELRPPLECLDVPIAHFDLEREIERLRSEEAWRDSGHNGKTLTKHPDMRVVLSVLKAGHTIPRHAIHGATALQGIAGRARIHCGKRSLEVLPGQVLLLERDVPFDVEALGDCAYLLTFAKAPAVEAAWT